MFQSNQANQANPNYRPGEWWATRYRTTLVGDNLEELKIRAVNMCHAQVMEENPGIMPLHCMVTLIDGRNVCESEMATLRYGRPNSGLAGIPQNNSQRPQQTTEGLRETCRSFSFTDVMNNRDTYQLTDMHASLIGLDTDISDRDNFVSFYLMTNDVVQYKVENWVYTYNGQTEICQNLSKII